MFDDHDPLSAFDADVGPNRLAYGPGVVARLGEIVGRHGRRALLVTDPGLIACGHVEKAVTSLAGSGVVTTLFADTDPNPGEAQVAAGVAAARAHGADVLVAVGGGSAMDTAKGINFVLTNGGRMEDYWGHDKATRPMLPSIGVPTTAGTGSEAQSFALISQDGTHRKMACGDRKARFQAVLLDPELVTTVPRRIAAVTGLDAIGHAVESYVTTRRNPLSTMHARAAFALLDASFEAMCEPSPSVATCGRMLLGAYLAGAAIEASMLGAAHACANPLTSRHDVEHGVAVALMLPAVVRFNAEVVRHRYATLASVAGVTDAEGLAQRLEHLRRVGGLPERLRDLGVATDQLSQLAEDAVEQWTGTFNPRPVAVAELRRLYEAAW